MATEHQPGSAEDLTAFKNAVFRVRNAIIISTDNAGCIMGFNTFAEEVLGYQASEALQRPITEILFGTPSDNVPSQYNFKDFADFLRQIETSPESEWVLSSKNKDNFPAILSLSSIGKTSGHIFTGIDIREQQRIETAFEGIQLFNEKILATTPTILYLYDIQAKQIVFSNRDFYESFGYSEKEVANMPYDFFSALLHEDDTEKFKAHEEKVTKSFDGEIVEADFRVCHASGAWRWIQNRDTVFMRGSDGVPTLILGASLDITERKMYEDTLSEVNYQLLAANKVLSDANNLKTELLGIAAHDLKNPLSIIKGLSSILEKNDDQEVAEFSTVITQAAQQMITLINELLESAAIESGKYPLHIERVNLIALLNYVIESNAPAANKKQQVIHTSFDADYTIMADASSIRQILDNLISNAIKYSPLGKNIYTSVQRKGRHIQIIVRDEGPGLTAQDRQKMFGKFQRLNAQPTGGESSSGLGLSIVKQLVELHNGTIRAESDGIGKGTALIVELPYNEEGA